MRFLRRLGFAVLGLLILLTVLFGVLYAANREGALLLLGSIVGEFVNNHRPPPIADGLIFDSDWLRNERASARITAKLRKMFPAGSNENAIRSLLHLEGFVPDPAPAKDCIADESKVLRIGKAFQLCPSYDWRRSMRYDWGNIPCDESLIVRWSAGAHGRLRQISGYYGNACL